MTEIHISNTLDWQNLIAMLRAKHEIDDLSIKYFDEENDEVSINSQSEWQNALMVSECCGNKLKISVRKASTNEVIEQLLLIIDQDKPKIKDSFLLHFDRKVTTNKINDDYNRMVNDDDDDFFANNFSSFDKNSFFCPIKTTTTNNNQIIVDNNNHNINNYDTAASAANYAVPPAWFTEGLKQMKSEILRDIEERMKALLADYSRQQQQQPALVNDSVELETERLFNELEKLYVSDRDEHVRVSQIYEKLVLMNAYNAAFCGDANIPDGTKCEPNMKFKKRWIVRNTGKLLWPESCIELVNVNGDIKCFNRRVQVLPTQPIETVEIEVDLLAPSSAGLYYSEWVLMRRGFQFGPKVWCQIQVVEPEVIVETTTTLSSSPSGQAKETQTFLFDEIRMPINEFQQKTFELNEMTTTPTKEVCSLNTSHSTITTLTMPITDKFVDQFECDDSPTTWPLTKLNKSFSITEIDDNSDIDGASEDDDDENAEFVIIPDCLDLTKKWVPQEDYLTKSCLLLSTTSKNKLIDSSTEPLLPKSAADKDEQQNLMIFSNQSSTSVISDDMMDASGGNDVSLNTSKLEDSNLITFTECNTQQQQQTPLPPSPQPEQPQAINETTTTTVSAASNYIVESAINTSSSSPSAPPMSPMSPPVVKIINKQPANLMDKLVSMGFCNRSLNKRLLDKYSDNIAEVIEHLINKEDNDWASNRH